jgi:hypothetical protein
MIPWFDIFKIKTVNTVNVRPGRLRRDVEEIKEVKEVKERCKCYGCPSTKRSWSGSGSELGCAVAWLWNLALVST